MTDTKIICLDTYLDPHQAEIVRGLLQTHNIYCFIENTHANNTMFHLQHALGGVRVMIADHDIEKAIAILKEHYKTPDVTEKPWLPKESNKIWKLPLSFVVTFFTGVPFWFKKKK